MNFEMLGFVFDVYYDVLARNIYWMNQKVHNFVWEYILNIKALCAS